MLNLKVQLEKHNNIFLTNNEFKKVINHLNKGSVFEKAKTLRDKMQLTKDNGESIYLEFIQQEHWCQNRFQVTRQVTMEGSYKNKYDVTILVNELPLVQIELKRRGLGLKEAFNQTNRYQRHSYGAGVGLFQYIQIFIISNGENTKYYANNRKESYKQTFYWSDKQNKPIRQLSDFTQEFLEPCHMSKMVTKYIVLNEALKMLMVLRPYQYYAVEAIVERVKNSHKNGYIWHTTGSGKTLTSFKASQILKNIPKVNRVVFVVDRKDLDYQTQKEFDAFSKGSVDATEDSRTELDIEVEDTCNELVEGIDKKELLESDDRLEKIVDYIIAHHDRKTHSKQFTAMLCVSSVDCLIKYYELFKKKNHNLNIATIFSYTANEDDKDANGMIEEEELAIADKPSGKGINKHTRDKLEDFIGDYNKMFNAKFTTKDSQSFYNYYNDISKKVKNRQIDILLVVNMFLTGFDSKTLNTLYADKNLKYHGLILMISPKPLKSTGAKKKSKQLRRFVSRRIWCLINSGKYWIITFSPSVNH